MGVVEYNCMKDDILNIKNQAIAQITAANDSAELKESGLNFWQERKIHNSS